MSTTRTGETYASSRSRRRRDGCTECRRKKVKCDLQLPICSRCTRFPKGCRYSLNLISQSPRDFACGIRDEAQQDVVKSYRGSRLHTAALDKAPLHQPALTLSPFLSRSEARFFMHVFSTETSIRLFPAAPDIFLQRMISSALETPHLLYALLAAASSHHGRLVREARPRSKLNCLQFTSSAITSLRSSLSGSNGVVDAEVIATAMALCTNDVCNGDMNAWRTHLGGVMRLLLSFLGRYEKTSTASDMYVECLVKWFTTMNVLAASSGIVETCPPDGQDLLMRAATSPSNAMHVDTICGYSLDLVPLLSQITRLVRLKNSRENTVPPLSEGRDEWLQRIMPTVVFLERQVSSLAGRTVSDVSAGSDRDLTVELEHTNNAFVYCTLLHLHRHVQMLPRSHPKIRGDVKQIIKAMEYIRPSSPANILILWPVFSAGCETEDVDERSFLQSRMGEMQRLGMGNFTRARELLHRYWESNSSLQWDLYFAQQGIELVLF